MAKKNSLEEVTIRLEIAEKTLMDLKDLICSAELKTDVDALMFAKNRTAMFALASEAYCYISEIREMLRNINKTGMGDVA